MFDLVMRDLGDVVPAQIGEERENEVRRTAEGLKSHPTDDLSVWGYVSKFGAVQSHASQSPDRHVVPLR